MEDLDRFMLELEEEKKLVVVRKLKKFTKETKP